MTYAWKFITCAVIGVCVFFNLYQSHRYWTDGDEPHYLVVTSSLMKDFDLRLDNNYQQKDYLSHHGAVIEHGHVQIDNTGIARPFHGILPSLAYIPAFIATQNAVGPKLFQLVVFMATIYVLIVLTEEIAGKKQLFASMLHFILAPVCMIYMTVLYPDIFQALFILLGVYGMVKYTKKPSSYLYLVLSSVSFGLSLFVHYKIALNIVLILCIACVFIGYNLYRKTMSFKDIQKHILPVFIATIPFWIFLFLHGAMTYTWYGTLSLSAIQDAGRGSILSRFTGNPVTHLAGQLFDYDAGIMWYHTLLPIMFFGFGVWAKKHFLSFALLCVSSIPIIFLNAFYDDWTAGFSPASRYLVPYMLLFFPAFYFGFITLFQYSVGKLYVYVASVLNCILCVFVLSDSGRYGYPSFAGYNYYWREMLLSVQGGAIDRLFSHMSFFNTKMLSPQVVVSCICIGLMLIASVVCARKYTPSDESDML